MISRRRIMLISAALLLTGCGTDAVKGLSRGGTAETDNYRIAIPNTLYQAAEPETVLWDYTFLDRSGYMISVQDFDFGYEPKDFLGEEYEAGEAAFEAGTLGSYDYCGWTAAADNCQGTVLQTHPGSHRREPDIQAARPPPDKASGDACPSD